MITEDYVSFETAKLLKEKGFDEDIDLWYDENGEMFSQHKYDISRDWRARANQKVYLCPTLQMAMKWLREKEQLYIMLDFARPNCIEYKIYRYECEIGRKDLLYYNYEESYEQATEAAIKYCLENLI